MTREQRLLAGAREWLAAAHTEFGAGRLHVAFEAGRHAAELAAKAMILRTTGEHPKSHLVAAPLARLGVLPSDVDPRALHRILSEFTLGTYGFGIRIESQDVRACIEMAEKLVAAARESIGDEPPAT